MTDLPPVRRLLTDAPDTPCIDVVVLPYDDRLLRRKRLVTVRGDAFLIDLPAVTNLDVYWGVELADGSTIQILGADEPLLEITGDLPRLAWHIGNRHAPCQIEADRLLIRQDHVLEAMLLHLGARVVPCCEPFTPDGGAYGLGRTMGHDHGGHPHADHPGHAHVHHHASQGPGETSEPEPDPA